MLTRSGGPPTRVLLLVTALLAVAGSVLLALGLAGPAQIPQSALEPVPAGSSVEVGDEGLSLWSPDAASFETAVCTAGSTPLLRPVETYSITVGGTEYHEVARSPRALVAGSYPVTCAPEQTLFAGPHAEQTVPSPVRGPLGVLAGAALLALALVLGVIALLAHRRQKRLEAWRVPRHRLDPSLRATEDEAPSQEVAAAAEDAAADEAPRRDRSRRSRRARD